MKKMNCINDACGNGGSFRLQDAESKTLSNDYVTVKQYKGLEVATGRKG